MLPWTRPSAYSSDRKHRLKSIKSSLVRPADRTSYFCTMDQRECSRTRRRTSLRGRREGGGGREKRGERREG